jgi:hypothetical protein
MFVHHDTRSVGLVSNRTVVRLVAMGARREARRALYRPARGDRQARGRERATALTPGESGRYRPALARVGARVWARGRRRTDRARVRRARVRWRDVIGPCVPRGLAVFYRLESKTFEKNCKKSQISFPIHL